MSIWNKYRWLDRVVGKHFRLCITNNFHYRPCFYSPYIFANWGDPDSKGIGVSLIAFTVSAYYYPNGDAHEYTGVSAVAYEEDCIESESDYCDNCVDHVELLTKDNVALRDEI